MKALVRFMDWPLRAKMAALLVVASLLPLAIATYINIREAQGRLLVNTEALLAARGDQLVRELDTFNRGYQRSVDRVAQLPNVVEFCQAQSADSERLKPTLRTLLTVWPASDGAIRGIGILDLSGVIRIATEDQLVGTNRSFRKYFQEALRGIPVISDVYLSGPEVSNVPTIAYAAPVFGPNRKLIGITVLWVRAAALWNIAKNSNGLAGPNSFAVLFDHQGIRIAHTYNDDIVFHPGDKLDPATVDALAAERRFGEKTRQLLEDVRSFPEQFERARSESPELGIFRGFAPVNQKWNYGVARRFETVPWTVFYMIPEQSLNAQIAQMTRQKTTFAGVIMLLALFAGILVAAVILKPIGSLSTATKLIAGGDLTARVRAGYTDELGQLGTSFNSMAEQIEAQATSLQRARDGLELRVEERTAELRESQERIRAVIDTALDGIINMNHEGKIVDFNPAAERIFGYRSNEVIGQELADVIIPSSVREQHRRGLAHYLATGEGPVLGKRLEMTGLRADSSEVPIELSITRMPGAGSPMFTGFLRDITDRKLAEGKVQSQLARLEMLNRITHAIGERQDLQSIFQVVIRTLEEHLPIDFSCICLYEPADNTLTVTSVGLHSGALAMKLAMTERARIVIDENGLSRCVHGHLVYEPDIRQTTFPFPQRLAKGGLCSLVAAPLLVESKVFGILVAARVKPESFSSGECEFLRQLSEHVALATHQAQLYDALQQAYNDLRQTQQTVTQQERLSALGQMASGIAHDINNAISPVALYTESLLEKEPNLSPRARDYLETIRRAIHDVAETVASMREFYRQRETQLTLMPVALNRLVPQVVDLTRARWNDMPQQRSIVIRMQTELAPDLPAIMGVESEIRDALTNLIFNAVDAMPNGGALTVRTKVKQRAQNSEEAPALRHVDVEVTDTGAGMDVETRRRCLEPFFTTKGERGTGLGLAMVYGMVQRHSADIEIESTPGKGTTMRLSFPAPTTLSAGPDQPTTVSVLPSRLRILVIDDDPLLIKSLRDALETDGHVVVTANGGQEGIDVFKAARGSSEPFAVVMTDLGMPYVDGRKVASEIKIASPSTPVILLTGWGQRLVAEGDIPSHVDRVLSKPPKLRDLREALAYCCPPAKS